MDKNKQYKIQEYPVQEYSIQEKPKLLVRPENDRGFSPLEIELDVHVPVQERFRRVFGSDGVAMPLSFVNDPQFLNALLDYIKVGDKKVNSKKDYKKRKEESDDDRCIPPIENFSELYDQSNLARYYQARMKSLSKAYPNLSYDGGNDGGSYSKN